MTEPSERKQAPHSEVTSTIAVVDALRERILSSPQGAFLGSEAILLAEYEISRPTFRQVARVLEQEELLVVRRGVGGGYYARHPSLELVGTASRNYLRSHHVTIADVFEVLGPLSELMYRKAANSCDEAGNRMIQEIKRRFIDLLDGVIDVSAYPVLVEENSLALGDLVKNPLIGMQMSVLYQLSLSKLLRDGKIPSLESIERSIRLRIRLLDSIMANEEEVAVAVGRLLISSVHDSTSQQDVEKM